MSTLLVPGPFAVRLCNYVGDTLLGLPALRLLHDHGMRLQLYGKGWAPTLLSAYPWPITVRAGKLADRVRQLKQLRERCIADDAAFARRKINALVMPNSLSSAAELRLARFRISGAANEGRSILLSHLQPRIEAPHKLEWFWALACRLLDLQAPPPRSIDLALTEAARAGAEALIARHGLASGFLAIAPFAGGDVDGLDKRWPRFRELGALLDRLGLPVVICPGPGEESIAIEGYPKALCLTGVPLDVYAALLARARLLVANDTGPAHLAAAVGTPLISVLGPTPPEVWAPWGPTVQVVRRWPEWPSVDEVLERIAARLGS